jgi:hypothetical protein
LNVNFQVLIRYLAKKNYLMQVNNRNSKVFVLILLKFVYKSTEMESGNEFGKGVLVKF